MNTFLKTSLHAAGLALALSLAAPSAQAQPVINCAIGGVEGVKVALLPAISDSESRREEVHISSALASLLDIGTATSDFFRFTPGGEINPQIRVVIAAPSATGKIDGRFSTATFTVAGIFTSTQPRIRVYANLTSSDKNSGQFKLFKDTGTVEVNPTATDGSGDVLGVTARVFWTPAATSLLTRRNSAAVPANPGTTTLSRIFCEPNDTNNDGSGDNFFDSVGYYETGIIETNKRFALIVPHGGDVERKTSDQIDTVLDRLRLGFAVHGSLWQGNGSWGSSQTKERWHTTATAIYPRSHPALDALFNEADFAAAQPAQGGQLARPARPVQYALALHGYSDDDSDTIKGLILGGQADREAKCLVALRVQDELEAVRGNREEIGFRIHDPEGDLTVVDENDEVPEDAHSGLSANNLVNRLSPNPNGEAGWGGIQIEQSEPVRLDETNGQGGSGTGVRTAWLRHVVARGAANAIGELIAGTAPADACDQLTGSL